MVFESLHLGATMMVCGCGRSLNLLPPDPPLLTIGVNDAGRRVRTDYLVVLNGLASFPPERRRAIEASHARALFSQLDLTLTHAPLVRIRLGERGGTEIDPDDPRFPYSNTSPYVALCLARYLGAARIGLIGVDFSDHHFFADTGPYGLRKGMARIDQDYRRLASAFSAAGIEVVNLSPVSQLSAFPRQGLGDFLSQAATPGEATPAQDRRRNPLSAPADLWPDRPVEGGDGGSDAAPSAVGARRRRLMSIPSSRATPAGGDHGSLPRRIAVERSHGGIIGTFMDRMAQTLEALGIEVARGQRAQRAPAGQHRIVWNGRWCRADGRTLFCEHGWLPRAAFQISPNGINADSHLAPFHWNGEPLPATEAAWTEARLAAIRSDAESPGRDEWRCSPEAGVAALSGGVLPEDYLLVPLQMEGDTNIRRHVPPELRRMQSLIDAISAADPPWPVIFKQHPADLRAGNRHLRLRTRRPHDRILPHEAANIHQLLRLPRCRGVITLNSNVAHDSLLWDKPVIVLGNNLWPRSGPGPFMTTLPADWSELELQTRLPASCAARLAYAHYLLVNQWTLAELADTDRVAALLHASFATTRPSVPSEVTRLRRRARRNVPLLNVVARNRGWRFEDYKRCFAAASRDDIAVHCSDLPLPSADAWLYLRASEAGSSPDPSRTLVQIHDLAGADAYRPFAPRAAAARCAAFVLTHPAQAEILRTAGVAPAPEHCLLRPVGAPRAFRLREALSAVLTIGWVGRPYGSGDSDRKRLHWLIEAMRMDSGGKRVILLGERLEGAHRELVADRIQTTLLHRREYPYSRYPEVYRGLDCVVITSRDEAGPSCLFEALAAGVPVIGTRVGWLPALIEPGVNGFLVDSPSQIAEAVAELRSQRAAWLARAEPIRQSLQGWSLEDWVDENLGLALRVIAEGRSASRRRSEGAGPRWPAGSGRRAKGMTA